MGELELLITKPTFAAFFSSSQLLSLQNQIATIGCNSSVAVNLIETRYYALLKNLLDKHSKQNNSLVFKVVPMPLSKRGSMGPLFSVPSSADIKSTKETQLGSDFTFETFAVSSTNQMAYAAATAVAASPGTSYNPLFLYGGVGVGKTHLMLAIGNDVLSKKKDLKLIYCVGEEFTNEIVDAIQTKTTKRFKDKYRSAQLLLIDDVQFLEGKIRVQEEFFHTFNAVYRYGGQIVLTSDRPPHEIGRLEERLRSRFEGGLLVDMQKPDFELRCAIVRIKAKQKGIDLPFNIAQILAANTDSVRKLEGFLTSLLSEIQIKKTPLSEELAQQVVEKPSHHFLSTPKKPIIPKQAIDLVMKRFGVSLGQLKGPKRNRFLARPRQILMYLLRIELNLPLQEVGVWVGGRDHTTVIHAVETISRLLSTNVQMREDIAWIKKELLG